MRAATPEMTATLWAAVAAGILVGLLLARLMPRPRASPPRAGPPVETLNPGLPDVPEIVRQMLAVSGRRAMVPVILRLVDQLFEPEQAAVFVSRPDGRLALADGKGLPESLRGVEVDSGPSGLDPPSVPGLRTDACAPIFADQRLHGIVCLGGARRRQGEEKELLKMLADLSGLAIGQVERFKAIQDTANMDDLTAVFNKRFFQERMSAEIQRARRDGTGLSLLLLDIDHFKNYNDTSGHVAGDEVLKKVGQLLKASVREDDVVARYGGEEFVILYPGASKALACRLAQSLRHAVEVQAFPGGERQPLGRVTISGGVATFPEDAVTEVELIRAADQALYEAKNAGRNRILGASTAAAD
ncbi:MAG TPA: diguanylate cyclase [Vicinamibacteria bacterium]|nr:diguanylate cyclase [Vicinamibacteria bacterium]